MKPAMQLPPEPALERYMAFLFRVLVMARSRAYETDAQLAEVLDLVHNLPDLLLRWPDFETAWLESEAERLATKYPEWGWMRPALREPVRPDWQLRRKPAP
jgi:hypothetical protein